MEALGALALRRGEQELNNAIRVRVSERLEQNRVHDREDGGVDSDAERQGSDRGERESWIHAEHAHGMLEVVPEIAHSAGSIGGNIRACRKFFACSVIVSQFENLQSW